MESVQTMNGLRCDRKFGPVLWLIIFIACVLIVPRSESINNPEDLEVGSPAIPDVTIHQGTLRGINLVTHHSRNIFGFKGIPFAEPPVGDLRFKGPIPPSAWNGILDATEETNSCSQTIGSTIIGEEDCLYLNVYTPRLPTDDNLALLPVMVFIHGGAFRAGGNDAVMYGPEYLLDKDVVLVVPSYRLGLFGFLSTGDEVAPGNYGLKDLVRALEWNRDNIRYFGGDPEQTTIFGQSAGGIIVHLLTFSSSTDGLFQRYIVESGAALSYDAHRPKEVLAKRTVQLGEHLGCPTSLSTDLVNCLRDVTTEQLLGTDSIFKVWKNLPNVIWSPTTEPDIEGAFLTQKPADLMDAGQVRDLAWLSSVNHDEGINHAAAFYQNPDQFEDFLSNVDVALPLWLTYDTKVGDVAAYTAALKSYYLNDLTADRDLLLRNFTQLMGDALCGYPTYSANQKQLAYSQQPHFLASFEYRGALTYSKNDGGTEVAHGDELIYLFPLASDEFGPTAGSERNEADWQMVDTMVGLWTSFAISGTPSTNWDQYSSLDNYLRIGNSSDTSTEVHYNLLGNRMQFWDELTAATTWL